MKRSITWVVFHSLIIMLTLLSLATGFRIAVLNKPLLLWLDPILPQGELHYIHIASGFAITAIVLVYLVLSIRALKLANVVQLQQTPKNRSFFYHRFLHWCGYLLFPLIVVSGLILFFDGPEWVAVWDLHFVFACLVFAYLLFHGGGYFVHFGVAIFKRMLLPGHYKAALQWVVVAGSCLVGLFAWLLWGASATVPLQVAQMDIKQFIDIDGEPKEAIWQSAEKLTVQTHGGANFKDGNTTVTIQAAENGVEAYFLFTWEDATKSMQHLPLIKKEHGWQVQHNGFYEFNEMEFYEDKFAVMLSDHCESGAAGTVHLGPKPLADKPANWHGKGYHYAKDGNPRDVWHWKAVRTNDMYQADDNFFGAPQSAKAGERRYTAGYTADGKESGAYVMNWLWFQTHQVTPRRMPKDPAMIAPYQTKPFDQSWVISWFDYEPYKNAKDEYPLGTVMPSVLYRSNQFEGDRADVRARGVWRDGKWTLEVSRRLDTESNNDEIIKDGVCMWVAAFDQSQVAHTRHHQAVTLQFEGRHD